MNCWEQLPGLKDTEALSGGKGTTLRSGFSQFEYVSMSN